MLYLGRYLFYSLNRLEGPDLGRGFCPRPGPFTPLNRAVCLLGDRNLERVGFSDEGGSFLGNTKGRRGPGWSNDRGVPLKCIEVLNGCRNIIPLQVLHKTVFGSEGMRGRRGTCTIAEGIVEVSGENASLWIQFRGGW